METPTTFADTLVSAQDAALETLVRLTELDSTSDWSEAQAQIEQVRLSAAVVILQQQAPLDLSQLGGLFGTSDDGEGAEVHTLETVTPEPANGEFLDPHGAPPIGGTG